MKRTLHEELDAKALGWDFVRKIYAGDPPPADPPDPNAVWDRVDELWRESDASLRRRIKESLEKNDG